ncbi:IclR family transcriptional regulator [Micromonospora sp. WMMD558]|uniref:IclR family transcriptional regulator n=1 Tax=Micromonospora sp. WMMD558 TaxID=3403462 RepID=UPI003BF529EC
MKSVQASESQHVESLGRVLDVLELFTAGGPELSLTDIAERLKWPTPTAHRVVSTLLARGFLARDPRTKRLRIGMSVMRLVGPLMSGLALPDLAQPFLRTLAQDTGETVNLAVLDGAEVLYLASAPGSFLLRVDTTPGLRTPAHCTALGKCMLAQLDPADAQQQLGGAPYVARTDRSVQSWEQLAAQLDTIRSDGFALSLEEYEAGLNSCAVPVPTHNGVIAAINIAASAIRVPAQDLVTTFVPRLKATAEAIARAQGLEPDNP